MWRVFSGEMLKGTKHDIESIMLAEKYCLLLSDFHCDVSLMRAISLLFSILLLSLSVCLLASYFCTSNIPSLVKMLPGYLKSEACSTLCLLNNKYLEL